MSLNLQGGLESFNPSSAIKAGGSVIGIGGTSYSSNKISNSGSTLSFGAKPIDLPLGMTFNDLENAYKSGTKIQSFDPITSQMNEIEITGLSKNNLPGGLGGDTYIVEGYITPQNPNPKPSKPFRNISMRVAKDGFISNDGLDAWLGGSI
jgi:hypothetical protein